MIVILGAFAGPVRGLYSGVLRRLSPFFASIVLLLHSGCFTLTPPVPAPEVRQHLNVVAIAPAQYVPVSNFITFAKGKGAGAGKGAAIMGGTAATISAVTFGSLAIAAPMTAPVMVLAGVLATVSTTTVGAVHGAQQAVQTDAAQQVDSIINAAVAELDAHNDLAERLTPFLNADRSIHLASVYPSGPDSAAARPDYAQLRAREVDAVIEVAVTEVGFESCGPEWFEGGLLRACADNPNKERVALFLSAQARLVRVSDGAELFIRQFRYASPRRGIPQWVVNDGQRLAEEFENAYRELAERIYDEIFLVTPLELPVVSAWEIPSTGSPRYGICWLAPVYPEVDKLYNPFSPPPTSCSPTVLLFSTIDTVRPRLRWGEFPRDLDRQQLDPAIIKKIDNVAYDLKIWEAEDCDRGRLIYQRTGLVGPEHLMEESLAPASRYFWSVRARFDFDGLPMVTRWAFFDTYSRNCFSNDLHNWQYHRFITP